MKVNKLKKILSAVTNTFYLLVLISVIIGTSYTLISIIKTPDLNVTTIIRKKSSKVYDNDNNFVKQLESEDYPNVSYKDLPDVFINALISCEDVRYFMHNGIDLPRLLMAIKNNVSSFSFKEGASTISQQLVKNMMLTNTKSIERKIQEAYLTLKIEKLYSKEQIIEFYCNYVCFDGVNHGVESASHKYFNKSVRNLTLPEAALLAGIVNLPTTYNPLRNPDAAYRRKNTVLSLMYINNFITKKEYESASSLSIDKLINHVNKSDDNTYSYQAYIDIVYKQIYEKTGYDPYTTPMEIYTYMDTSLQAKIDAIQSGTSNSVSFNNDLQQLASAIIDNENGALIAVFGGRNYTGQKLYNRCSDMLRQPASTIKIVLSYALAYQHLNWSNMHTLTDEQTYYPNSNVVINNVDHEYLGDISIRDAIGFSRNTTAVSTLNQVINKIGIENVINYLRELNLMDNGEFSYSYALGGYTYGVSPLCLAASYSMIARMGEYIEPLCVKSIRLLDGSDTTITFTPKRIKLLDETSCYLLLDVMKQVMDANIWSISDCKPKNVYAVAKTGTSSFDDKIIKQYNYPKGASKDRWLVSTCKEYSIAIWSGFDETMEDEKTYFKGENGDQNIVKRFNKFILSSLLPNGNESFTRPDGLKNIEIIKGYNYLLPNTQIEDTYIVDAIFKENSVPNTYFEEKQIDENVRYDYFIIDDTLNVVFESKSKTYDYYDKLLGGKQIIVDIYKNNELIESVISEDIFSYKLESGIYDFKMYYKYKNGFLSGPSSSIFFSYL